MEERHFKKIIKKAEANIPEVNNKQSLDSLLNLFEAKIQMMEEWRNTTLEEYDHEKHLEIPAEQSAQIADLLEQYVTKDGTQLITLNVIESGELKSYNDMFLPVPQGLEPDFIWHYTWVMGNPKRDFVAYLATIIYQGHFSLPQFEEFHEFDWDTRVKQLFSSKKEPKRYDMEDEALFMRWYTFRDQVQIAISDFEYEGSKNINLYRRIIHTLKDPVIKSCYFNIKENPSIMSRIKGLLN